MQLKKMQQKKLKPNDSTLATLSITCSKALQLDLAEAFLNQISECLYPHPYNALLASCDELVSSIMKFQNRIFIYHFIVCKTIIVLLYSLIRILKDSYLRCCVLSERKGQ